MARTRKAKELAPPAADGAAHEETADVETQAQGPPTVRKRGPRVWRPLLNQKRRRGCDCGTAEACFACRRCMEQHCTCGAAGRSTVTALCRESRACNCRVVADGASRCVLCLGCRQPYANHSHCRCAPHQEAMRRLAGDEKKPSEADKAPCRCFDRVAVEPEQQQRRRKRLALIGRRAGVPSSQGLYGRKVAGALGDFGESDIESEGDGDELSDRFPVARSSAEELEDTLTAARIVNSKPYDDLRAPQQPIEWSGAKPFQASIAHTPETFSGYKPVMSKVARAAMNRRVMPRQLDRAIENALFVEDQERAMPSEEMVDYLILASSVKSSRMPEMVGTLDNTAATAVGIVVEEYVQQLVVRSDRQSLCQATKEAVGDFASMLLRDFNYPLFLQKFNLRPLSLLSMEELQDVREQLVQLIFTEFLATQRPVDRGGLMASAQKTPLCDRIREVVTAEMAATQAHAVADQQPPLPLGSSVALGEEKSVKAVKIAQRTSKLTGQLIYKYDVAATIGDKHIAKVVLDGFESRQAAERSLMGMRKALEKQDKRISKIEHPSPPRMIDDPIVAELYQQLLNQVKQTKSLQGNANASEPSTATAKVIDDGRRPGQDNGSPRSRSHRVTRQRA